MKYRLLYYSLLAAVLMAAGSLSLRADNDDSDAFGVRFSGEVVKPVLPQ